MHKRNTRRTKNTPSTKSPKALNIISSIKNYIGIDENFLLQDLIYSPSFSWLTCAILLPIELILNILVINHVKYTEIDWEAYMHEVEGFINGTLDYAKLNGSTGPLVYPAGFVYIFSVLYSITDCGRIIPLAQYIFAGIYLVNLVVIFRIYLKSTDLPPYMYLLLSCTAYRIHSIYILRLFNDTIAMLFLYSAVYAFLSNRWLLGCVVYSLGVSVKMNVLLFAPGLLVLLLQFNSPIRTVCYLSVCAVTQLILGLPFLLTYPVNYMSRAFQFNRIFLYKWTVNWRFLPEEIFHDRLFHITLITVLIVILSALYYFKWSKPIYSPLICFKRISQKGEFSKSVNCHILFVLFTSNFCGIAFSRTLHFQFYVWYFHTLHFLVWKRRCPVALAVCLLGLIELSYKIFPSTYWSSAILQLSHVIILVMQFF
ncbi:Dol-P-Man:Man(5)GlcNAc(2)-PP-Dol alpha-1,3-mannosyltransferase [Oopsacas minuta]|uniref:dolichyl-P-Man:Man5GlcNAc2-PP-dolichol alpha-1,3-mannosyltransferase n=1 Tax=Oopsacas minuta TaxID=111878 RepID=A0AAV7JET7_9METZ|nr:Dol-P-Man:Man(5)GlcNAc(2)-PP-Dol alpha-1,3-mannosyltransferase [Oopsacas minuta]